MVPTLCPPRACIGMEKANRLRYSDGIQWLILELAKLVGRLGSKGINLSAVPVAFQNQAAVYDGEDALFVNKNQGFLREQPDIKVLGFPNLKALVEFLCAFDMGIECDRPYIGPLFELLFNTKIDQDVLRWNRQAPPYDTSWERGRCIRDLRPWIDHLTPSGGVVPAGPARETVLACVLTHPSKKESKFLPAWDPILLEAELSPNPFRREALATALTDIPAGQHWTASTHPETLEREWLKRLRQGPMPPPALSLNVKVPPLWGSLKRDQLYIEEEEEETALKEALKCDNPTCTNLAFFGRAAPAFCPAPLDPTAAEGGGAIDGCYKYFCCGVCLEVTCSSHTVMDAVLDAGQAAHQALPCRPGTWLARVNRELTRLLDFLQSLSESSLYARCEHCEGAVPIGTIWVHSDRCPRIPTTEDERREARRIMRRHASRSGDPCLSELIEDMKRSVRRNISEDTEAFEGLVACLGPTHKRVRPQYIDRPP